MKFWIAIFLVNAAAFISALRVIYGWDLALIIAMPASICQWVLLLKMIRGDYNKMIVLDAPDWGDGMPGRMG